MRRLALGALAALLLASCDGGGPQPGTLTVRLTGPASGATARSLKFRLVGSQTGVTAPGSGAFALISDVLPGDTTVVAVFAAVGDSLNGAVVAHVAVPDVHAASSYVAQAVEVAGPFYSLLTAAQFQLTIAKQ